MEPRVETLRADDGAALVTRWFEPTIGAGPETVVIAPGMGIPQTFYDALAEWLAGVGRRVVTFDYRGMGLSRAGSLRGFEASLSDWASLDAEVVLRTAAERASSGRVVWLGHSLGGQILPMVPSHERADRVITIASGSGYWRECAARLRITGPFLWHVAVPLAVAMVGYFPGRRLRAVGDLPAGVMHQWCRWCLHPDYLIGVEGEALAERFTRFAAPVHALYFSDDEFMTDAGIEWLHAQYRAAQRTLIRITPADAGVTRIGHFGFFRPAIGSALWAAHLGPALGLKASPE